MDLYWILIFYYQYLTTGAPGRRGIGFGIEIELGM
jgi:hypothetical protein